MGLEGERVRHDEEDDGGAGERGERSILITCLNFSGASATPSQADQNPPLRSKSPTWTL